MFENIQFSEIIHLLRYDPEEPMIFTSGLFLWVFLVFSFIYSRLGSRNTLRIAFVTLFSYYFYYKSSGLYFLALAFVTVSDFFLARLIAREPLRSNRAKLLMGASVGIDLALLGYFKYVNFFGSLFCGSWTPVDIFLPVGVSFFTFQSLSYSIDIYRGKIKPLDSLLDYAFYISFFPQLVAGPIVRASDFIPQIRRRPVVTDEMFGTGAFLIMTGIIKKAVISDYIGINFVDRVFEQPILYSGVENILATYGYTLQIYCDFSGYSDVAIGIALWLGFHFPENFRTPYKSASITEFWRRWHISLSSWLRDYLYISLGGNRKGKVRQYVNLMITMLLGGLWHGANLTFVLWGGLHGAMLCIEKAWYSFMPNLSPIRFIKAPAGDADTVRGGRRAVVRIMKVLCTIVTFHIVAASWVLFRAKNFDMAAQMFTQIFTKTDFNVLGSWIVSFKEVALLMLIGYAMHLCPERLVQCVKNAVVRSHFLVKVLLMVFVIWLVFQVKNSEIQPFIYFQF